LTSGRIDKRRGCRQAPAMSDDDDNEPPSLRQAQDEQGTTDSPSADVPPDRLAINPRSPFHDSARLGRGIGIRFKGVERTNVEEYCVSEGWVRVQAGKTLDRKGQPLTIKLSGPVEAWYQDLGEAAPVTKKEG